jgi:hypothetical protein
MACKWKSALFARCTHGWPRTFANEISADPKNDHEEVVFKISIDLASKLNGG